MGRGKATLAKGRRVSGAGGSRTGEEAGRPMDILVILVCCLRRIHSRRRAKACTERLYRGG